MSVVFGPNSKTTLTNDINFYIRFNLTTVNKSKVKCLKALQLCPKVPSKTHRTSFSTEISCSVQSSKLTLNYIVLKDNY